MTREDWLVRACEEFLPRFKSAGAGATPKFRVSVGWPVGSRGGKGGSHKIGQCFCCSCSTDGTHEMFISPVLDDVGVVLATLAHELVHAFVGIQAKHGKEFKIVAERVGLTGKMTATTAGPELAKACIVIASKLGPYPHARMTMQDKLRKAQTTRYHKVVCPDCRYTARITSKWIDVGLPVCPCGTTMVEDSAAESEPGDGE